MIILYLFPHHYVSSQSHIKVKPNFGQDWFIYQKTRFLGRLQIACEHCQIDRPFIHSPPHLNFWQIFDSCFHFLAQIQTQYRSNCFPSHEYALFQDNIQQARSLTYDIWPFEEKVWISINETYSVVGISTREYAAKWYKAEKLWVRAWKNKKSIF
jgi:hypothetical protein